MHHLGIDVSRSSAFLDEWRGQLVYARIRTNPPGDVAKMLVMRQINYLTHFRHIGEEPESFLRPKVVERLHDVVGDKGNRGSRLGELVVAGNPEREIELKTRSL